MHARRKDKDVAKGGLAGVGVAAVLVVCCSAFPLLAALAGSVALGTVLGVGVGAIALVALGGVGITWMRRRRACETQPSAAPAPAARRSDEVAR